MAESAKELKEILKLSTSIGKAYSDLSDLSDKRNKSLKKESDTQKGIVTGVKDEASARKAILRLQERHIASANKNYGVNKSIGAQLNATNKGAQGALKTEVNKYNILGKVNKITNSISDGIENGLGSLQGSLREVPVIGKAMEGLIPFDKLKGGVARLGNAFKGGFKGAFSSANIQSKGFVKAFGGGLKSGFGGMAKAAARLGPALMGPQGIVVAIVAVLALGVIAMYRLEKASRAFRNETGLLNSQMGDVETTINSVYMETAGLGASMEDVAKNAAAFVNEFGGIEKPSENVVKSLTVLNKNFGVAVGDAVKVNKAFQNMGGLSADVAQSNAESLVSLAEAEGVAPRKVMADIADSAEEAGGFFRGNIQALGAAAINAAKMGSSLKEAAKVSRGLLDYQNSVSGEMEASAILGTNLNFSQSRYLAATGDVVGAQSEMVKQLRNRVDLENASVFEREAMEKATGMQFSQIQNMARLQKLNLNLDEKQNALLQKAIKGGLDIKNMSADDIKAKTEALAKQQKMQGELESMGNAMKALGSTLLQAFMPIGKMIVGALSVLMPIVKGIFGTISNSINSLMKAFDPIREIFNDIFGGKETEGFKKTLEVIGNILGGVISFGINTMANGIKMVMNILGGVYKIFKGLFTLDFDMVLDGFLSLGEGIMRYFAAIPMVLFDTIKDIFPGIGTWLEGLWSSIKTSILSMIDGMLPDWVLRMLGTNPMVPVIGKGALPETGNDPNASVQEIEAVNNPILQKKEDFATITPQQTISDIAAASTNNSNIDMSAVVNAIKELTSVSSSNKDVYIDNEKITSRISKTQEKSNINQFGIMGA
jgi:hypothetical protein